MSVYTVIYLVLVYTVISLVLVYTVIYLVLVYTVISLVLVYTVIYLVLMYTVISLVLVYTANSNRQIVVVGQKDYTGSDNIQLNCYSEIVNMPESLVSVPE